MKLPKESVVFSHCLIGNIELKNRLVRSATYENAATIDGKVTEKLIAIYRELAEGGVGLIITGAAGVSAKAMSFRFGLGIYDDSLIRDLRKISKSVRDADSTCKIMLQIFHPGRQIIPEQPGPKFIGGLPRALLAYIQRHPDSLRPEGQHKTAVEPTAPSPIYDAFFERTPRALTVEEINEVTDAFAEAIRRAQEAEFHGVQIHAAHGYLLSSFLSPYTNKRDDQYGGSTENRVRILREIHEKSTKKVGEDFPILVKINTTDFLPGGMDIQEAAKSAEILEKIGFAAIETSGGMWEAVTQGQEKLGWPPVILPEARTEIKSKDQEAYFLPAAKALRETIDCPIILVGGLKSFDRIEQILESGSADFVSLSRPLIRQPDLPNLWLSGSGPKRAECISCNACLPIGAEPTRCRAKIDQPEKTGNTGTLHK
jgi:2,4-dienoyl-CoA reductase-like NADH-dependent reductase (Old Yellow Enzyme family)